MQTEDRETPWSQWLEGECGECIRKGFGKLEFKTSKSLYYDELEAGEAQTI